jgi:hypothetical protein
METIVIHPENEKQQKALQLILEGFKVPYENEPASDATDYLRSTQANKEWLDTAMTEAKNGEGAETESFSNH